MRFLLRAAITLTVGCLCAAAGAAPLAYVESASGDLGYGAFTVLPLDAGLNTVTGQMHALTLLDANGQYQIDSDLDPVQLHLPAGLRVTEMRVDISFIDTTSNTQAMDWRWSLLAGVPGQEYSTCFVVVAPSAFCSTDAPNGGLLFAGMPSTASDYIVTQGVNWMGRGPLLDTGGILDYTLTVTVSAVPEPGAMFLWLCALPVIVQASRRRRSAVERPGSIRN